MTLLNAQRSIEQIVIANKDCRVLGITSVRRGAGVSLICRGVAKAMAATGEKTLLVCTAQSGARTASAQPARPPLASVCVSPQGYGVLSVYSVDKDPLVSNALQLRQLLDTDFVDYSRIIVDLPPVMEEEGDALSVVALAPTCERVLVVCVIGSDGSAELSESVSLVRGAGARVSGIISNEFKRVDPWHKLRRMVGRAAAH